MEKFKYPLLDIKGKQYLEVKYRVAWFNEDKSDWTIETEIEYEEPGKWVRFKCLIKNPEGRVMRIARKTVEIKTPKDYEACETGSIGRALALMGYGTTDCAQDLEEDDIVDAPVEKHFKAVPKTETKEPYKITINGKFVGKTLYELTKEQIESYKTYWQALILDKKEVTPSVKEFITQATIYLENQKSKDHVKSIMKEQ